MVARELEGKMIFTAEPFEHRLHVGKVVVSPVESDAEHPVLSEGRHKQLNVLRPLPVLCQRSLQQGYGAHSGESIIIIIMSL